MKQFIEQTRTTKKGLVYGFSQSIIRGKNGRFQKILIRPGDIPKMIWVLFFMTDLVLIGILIGRHF